MLTCRPTGCTLHEWAFLSRLLVPRGVRRAAHPIRTVKNAATPKTIKKARRAINPISNAAYSFERSLTTTPRSMKSTGQVFRHGTCQVKHRSWDAASKCRNQ